MCSNVNLAFILTSIHSKQETSSEESGKWQSARTENLRKGRKEPKEDGKKKCLLSSRECPGNGLERRANEVGKW
jgi:hypothetical protein